MATPKNIRIEPDDWRAFERFRQLLQERTPHGRVRTSDAFRFCVDSATAVLTGEVHVADAGPPQPVTPTSMIWREPTTKSGQ